MARMHGRSPGSHRARPPFSSSERSLGRGSPTHRGYGMGGRKVALAATVVAAFALPATAQAKHRHHGSMHRVKHMVVIYEENHSFDNLYGGWEGVDGLKRADAAHTTQVSQAGQPFE